MGPKKHPIQTPQSEEDSSDETENFVTCQDCKRKFPLQSILTHLNNARSKRKCKKQYTEQETPVWLFQVAYTWWETFFYR